MSFSLPAGKYARFNYHGKLANMGKAYHYILGEWSKCSNHEIDHASLAFFTIDTYPEAGINYDVMIYVPVISG